MKMKLLTVALFSLFCLPLFGQDGVKPDASKDPKLNALLWMQNASEFRLLTRQAYRYAGEQLHKGLQDKNGCADEVQFKEGGFQGKKPSVILDVDETVLDNSPFNARNIIQGTAFNLENWNVWAHEEKARAVAGALEFITMAKKQGVEIFYVTNRRDGMRVATINNLKALGFPVTQAHLLTRNDKAGRGGDKVSRRAMVAVKHRIVLLIGDNMADVCSQMDNTDSSERNRIAKQKGEMLGARWIILTNPVYGGWERALKKANGSGLDQAKDD